MDTAQYTAAGLQCPVATLARAPATPVNPTLARAWLRLGEDISNRLQRKMDDNPRVWMLEVNGFLMDIRYAPREIQETAFEKGLIPYVP